MDPSREAREQLKQLLSRHDRAYEILEGATIEEAGGLLATEPDCVLLDRQLAEVDAEAFLREFRGREGILGCPPIILMGPSTDAELPVQTVRAGAHDHVYKDTVDADILDRSVRYSMERHRLVRELHDANHRAHHVATHCPLTGLPNRELLLDRASRAIASARRQKQLVALLFIDLDEFKAINHTHGHLGADYVLRAVAERLRQNRRATDTVARVGGDEFAILLSHPARSMDAGRVAEIVRRAVSRPIEVNGACVNVRASIGIAIFPDDADSPEELVQRADAAMYQAKHEGGSATCFPSTEMTRLAHSRLELERRLRSALASRQLELRFVPRVDGERRRIVGLEVVPRWKDPELGVVAPTEFMALAEETDLAGPMGRWMLRSACLQNRSWHREGLRRVPISVRCAQRQLIEPDFPQLIRDVLVESELEGRFLEIELKEGCFSRDLAAVSRMLNDVRSLGVRISLGGFGKGPCSLSVLGRLPIDVLKIDRSFIEDLDRDRGPILVGTLVSLARAFGLEPVAEGIETIEQLECLVEHGCHDAQGLLFSPALSPPEVREWLEASREGLDLPEEKPR